MVLIVLVALILIAKEIVVFNAESLVLISFILFITMLFSLSDQVVSLFQDRVESLKKEYFSQRTLKIVYLENYSKYLETKKDLLLGIKKLLVFYLLLKNAVVENARLSLEVRVYTATIEKLKTIASLDKQAYEKMFIEINRVLPELVKAEFKGNSSAAVESKEEVLNESIEALTKVN